MRRLVLIAVGVLALLWEAAPSRAQISPGPLSSAHRSLEGNSRCVQCHGLKRESIQEHCLECHGGIARLREQGRGFHAREGSGACEDCHPEHAGADFELIEWPDGSERQFRHARAGWALEGKHASASCGACHRPEFQSGAIAGAEPAGSTHDGRGWLGLESRCAQCHQDPHAGRLGEECRSCHGLEAWRPASGFDHAKTDYALDGKHTELACAKCHENPRLGAGSAAQGKAVPLYHPLPHADCRDCHADPHQGRFTGACAGCHVTKGFRLVGAGSFDHSLTSFPLRGAHATLECGRCHDEQKAWGKRPEHDRCGRCHEDAHGGQLRVTDAAALDCEACHTEKSWRGVEFDAARHAESGFPLVGAHARAECAACHRAPEGRTPDPAWGVAAVRLRMPAQRCLDCHAPAHGEELDPSRDCAECHGNDAWRPSLYDATRHAEAGWPLEGAHRRADCGACHGAGPSTADSDADVTPESVGAPWAFASLGRACSACHVDPHAGRYEDSAEWGPAHPCLRCHDQDSFVPSSLDPEAHRALGYALEGAHRAVPCFACHPGLAAAPAASTLRSRGGVPRELPFSQRRRDCRDCHDPARLPGSGVRP